MTSRRSLRAALYPLLFIPLVRCHMQMSWPFPLRSSLNPATPEAMKDYNMVFPLEADGSNFPCKGHQNDQPLQTTIAYTAGSTYNMTLAGSATHEGGSCQLSLSYDNGATFRVIKSMIGGCPLTSTYNFTIPSYAPIGTALFAWTWQNLVGKREFYMNCAEVNIVSASGSRRRQERDPYSIFDQLPYIWKANLPGINDCVTTEEVTPVYPHPGAEIEYGSGLSGFSPPTPGNCDAPTPYGQTYESIGGSHDAFSKTSVTYSTLADNTYRSSEMAATATSVSADFPSTAYGRLSTPVSASRVLSSPTQPPTQDAYGKRRLAAVQSISYSTVTSDCQGTVTVTVYPAALTTSTVTITPMPSYYTTAASASACSGTSASCACASGYDCQLLGPCTWACNYPTTVATSTISFGDSAKVTSTSEIDSSASQPSGSTVVVTTTSTVIPTQPSSSGTSSHPPYATGDIQSYLPCVPGTFICIDEDTWDTCDHYGGNDTNIPSASWVYGHPRNVSTGMECITFLSPYSSETSQYSQQATAPDGYYRDDRVVRARPDGDCYDDGSIKCTDDGQTFEICDQGGWVSLGSVANGTICSDGQIAGSA